MQFYHLMHLIVRMPTEWATELVGDVLLDSSDLVKIFTRGP